MTLKGQQRVIAHHAMPIVSNADQLAPTGLNLHADARSSGIKGIFKQLFHNRRRAFNDFSGSDLVGYLVREHMDPAHI